jgi:hypothetical protein
MTLTALDVLLVGFVAGVAATFVIAVLLYLVRRDDEDTVHDEDYEIHKACTSPDCDCPRGGFTCTKDFRPRGPEC